MSARLRKRLANSRPAMATAVTGRDHRTLWRRICIRTKKSSEVGQPD